VRRSPVQRAVARAGRAWLRLHQREVRAVVAAGGNGGGGSGIATAAVAVMVPAALDRRQHRPLLRLRCCGRLTLDRASSHRSPTPRCTMRSARRRRSTSSSARYVIRTVVLWCAHVRVRL
jgi:hypothetical protein